MSFDKNGLEPFNLIINKHQAIIKELAKTVMKRTMIQRLQLQQTLIHTGF